MLADRRDNTGENILASSFSIYFEVNDSVVSPMLAEKAILYLFLMFLSDTGWNISPSYIIFPGDAYPVHPLLACTEPYHNIL